MNIIIRDLDQTRLHFEAAIQRVGEQEAKRAFNRALNSEGDKIRTKVRRTLREQTGAKAGLITRETKSIKATFNNLAYVIEAKGRHLSLAHFNPSSFRYGVRAKPWGRFQRFPGAFLVRGNAFVREGKARFPIRMMYGPAIPKELLKDATRAAFEASQPAVLAEATRQLELALNRKRG